MRKADTDRLFRVLYRIGYRVYLGFCYFFRPACRGVYIAVWHRGAVLLIKNSYRSFFTIPGGGLRGNESAAGAAARELFEEVGIRVEPADLHLVGMFRTDYEFTRDTVALFEVDMPERPEITVDRREVVWAEFKNPNQALQRRLFPVVKQYLEAVQSGKGLGKTL
ncbi:MAG: NUDIX domain-containing protein [Thermodesulfobacteriota bacterium]